MGQFVGLQECLKGFHFSIRPVLIHVNGVDENGLDAGYFDKIIDFGNLLE
jgi:hypothetical protein